MGKVRSVPLRYLVTGDELKRKIRDAFDNIRDDAECVFDTCKGTELGEIRFTCYEINKCLLMSNAT